ncbi:MAG: long-chain-fatty-acid--CoA ligase [Burkholderiales bacterium]|nr:long-chain-fatty-acid--CoA ligase [Burkholderiales bacterium]
MQLIGSYCSFYDAALNNAKSLPSKKIIHDGNITLTNSELLDHIDSIASFLKDKGVRKGDKIAIVMGNSWQYIANIFAISKVGAVAVLINNFLKEDEIAYILNDSQSSMLFASGKFEKEVCNQPMKTDVKSIIWVDGVNRENYQNIDHNKILEAKAKTAEYIERTADELAVIIYTSGTTGKPKGAMLSFNNILSNVMSCVKHLDVKYGKIPMICYLPMFHAFTFTVSINLPIFYGSDLTIIRSIATKGDFANLLKQVLLKRIPYFVGVPDVYSAMAKASLPWYFHWFHNVKGFISGAAPLAEETMKNFKKSFKRGALLQGYGISECSPVVSVNLPKKNKIGSVGVPLPSYQVECFDEDMKQLPRGEVGEICVKGGNVMMGYYNRPKDTEEALVNGWFRTGDIGKVDEEDFIFILDRKKDLIISKGMNIYPREIEEVIYVNEKVNACAVVGLKDIEANETPIAYIELKEGETATDAEFKAFVKGHLAPFKQPRKFIFMDKLPRNATGKILKRELRDLLNNPA